MASWLSRLAGIVLVFSFAASPSPAVQPQSRSVSVGVYTDEQATRGQGLYSKRCASCHAPGLTGRTGPPLTGSDFFATWSAQPLLELANKIRKTMPRDETERLTEQETADLLSYILQLGKFPSGATELGGGEAALKQVNFPAPASPSPAAAAAQIPSLPAAGNVAQVMRGILFPSANIVFTVQSYDPGVKKPVMDASPSDAGFDWFAWGNSIYKGWDVVDYAAISVAESAQLMLTPGRRCENGRLVPVTDPDWIRFTNELADAGRAAYKASQTRDQETVSRSTDQLNTSCSNCHRVFRGRTHCAKP